MTGIVFMLALVISWCWIFVINRKVVAPSSPGLPLRLPWEQLKARIHRNAVASIGATPVGVEKI